MSLMGIEVKVVCFIALTLVTAFMLARPLNAEPPLNAAQDRIITSKLSRGMDVIFTNGSGKLVSGDNSFCVLFQNVGPTTSTDVHNVKVDFRLLVGRIEERPISADLLQDGVGRYCGHVNLGRQYYTPSSYYAFVHYADATGKKRTVRLHFAVR